jgi:hypothetical protein
MMSIHIQLPDVCDPLEYVILGVACISTNCYVHTHHAAISFGTIVISKEALQYLRTNECCMYITAPEP